MFAIPKCFGVGKLNNKGDNDIENNTDVLFVKAKNNVNVVRYMKNEFWHVPGTSTLHQITDICFISFQISFPYFIPTISFNSPTHLSLQTIKLSLLLSSILDHYTRIIKRGYYTIIKEVYSVTDKRQMSFLVVFNEITTKGQ